MALIEEIANMQQEGKSDQDITLILQGEGYGIKEISESIAQAKIKQAVSSDATLAQTESPNQEILQQSMMNTPTKEGQENEENSQASPQSPQSLQQAPAQSQAQAPPQYQQYQQQYQQEAPTQEGYQAPPDPYAQVYSQYQQYDPYQSNTNTDMMSEIAEQALAEKLSPLRKQFETLIDMKTTYDSRINAMDERLKRIERVLDRLQLSILQKVGDYVTNVEDIKKELVETQKSFKTMVNQKQVHHSTNKTPQIQE